MHRAGASISQISAVVTRPGSTVSRTIKNAPLRDDYKSLPRGHPRVTDERMDRRLVREARANRRMPLGELCQNIAPNISRRTVQRRLQQSNVQKWLAAKRPLLEPVHEQARLRWVLNKQHWDVWDFAEVGWSDEYSVKKGIGKERVWVFRTPAEKWIKDCINGEAKAGAWSIMIWAIFTGRKKGPLVCISGDSEVGRGGVRGIDILRLYQENLPNHMVPAD